MLTIALRPEIEQRVAERARDRGLPIAELVRTLIEDALDDLDDQEMASHRLTNPLPPLNSDQARKALGLED